MTDTSATEVPLITKDAERSDPDEHHQWALCLSGGGYRAMLFHLGSLWRLNELGYLPRLDRISSVSGGSITAGVLGAFWGDLGFGDSGVAASFEPVVVRRVRHMASETIDARAIFGGLLGRGEISDRVARSYRDHLFGDASLQDLPDRPRFVINATNVQSGALWRFSKPYAGDWKVGRVHDPKISLANAVAASSAFPPVLSPFTLELDPSDFDDEGAILTDRDYRKEVVLTDGGVYDNLGIETAWKSHANVLVSDGGGLLQPEEEPDGDWARHSLRINGLINNQVRSLRKRQVISSYRAGVKGGAYWGIRTNIADYGLADPLRAPFGETTELAKTRTRLKEIDDRHQERLINWGYAVTDAAMRKHVDPALPAPAGFPYPGAGVG